MSPSGLALAILFGGPEGTARAETETGYLLAAWGVGLLLLLLIGLLGPGTWRALGRALRRLPVSLGRREWLALGALTLGALGLRTLLSEPAALLSTFNDVKHAHDAMCLVGQARACELTPSYPWATNALHGLVFLLLGPSLTALYLTNALLSTLTVPLLWLLGLLLSGGRRSAAWLAAAALAGLPLAIRFAATGAQSTGFAFFATLSLVALAAFARAPHTRLLWLAGLAAALAAQSRYEGAAFSLVLLAAACFLSPAPLDALREPRFRLHLLVLGALGLAAAALPVLGLFHERDYASPGNLTPLWLRVALAGGVPVALWLLGSGLERRSWGRRLLWPLGIAATALFLAGPASYHVRMEHLLDPAAWPAFQHEGLWLPSFAERPWALLNPRAVPLPLLLLAALGAASALTRAARGPVAVFLVWAAVLTAILMQKKTGELPFEHLRTAVGAAPAVAGLVAWGGLALLDRVRARRERVAGLLFAALLAAPLLSLPMLRAGDYNNAREIAFLIERLATLPSPAIVIHPAQAREDERPLDRLFRIPELWWTLARIHAPGRDDRFLGANRALAEAEALLAQRERGRRLLFWEGLSCHRVGDEGSPSPLRPDCQAVHERFLLRPAAPPESIPNRPFESDFWPRLLIRGEQVTMRVWEIVGLRPAGSAGP